MKDREPPATFERAPYLYCRHRYRPQAQAVGTKAVAAVVVLAGAHRAQGIHIDFFGEFLSKKYLRQISILGFNEWKNRKSRGIIVISTFKMDITRVPFFFLISPLVSN